MAPGKLSMRAACPKVFLSVGSGNALPRVIYLSSCRATTYWEGALLGRGNCACGMNNSCADSSSGCNGDKDDAV